LLNLTKDDQPGGERTAQKPGWSSAAQAEQTEMVVYKF
jgi:hypothetical protein